jgi:predicted Zn-dependent peptidase
MTSFSGVGVSTTEPNKFIAVMDRLLEKTKTGGFTAEEVKNMKTTYLTSFYYRQETNSAQASSLASNEVLHNNWRRALTFNNDLKMVSVEDVDRAFNKYVTKLTWVYQGNPDKVTPSLYTTGPPPVQLPPTSVKGSKNN